MIIAEIYPNIPRKPLHRRLEKTSTFSLGEVDLDAIIGRLDPRTRNHLLNIGVGVEIEVENIPELATMGAPWEVVPDSSLRNNGVEYRTQYGPRMYELWPALKRFKEKVDKLRLVDSSYFSFSERTSVHVHIDVRNFTLDQIKNLVLLYILVENPLFLIADDARRHNVFCVPLRESNLIGRFEHIHAYLNDWQRYCAFNLQSLSKFGTVEFRHMSGRSNPRDIFLWTMALGLLQTAAWQYDHAQLLKDIEELKYSSLYDRLIQTVFFGLSRFMAYDARDFDDAASDAKLMFTAAQ